MILQNKKIPQMSISLKLFVIILVLVLPLNILSLIAVNKAVDKVKTNTRLMMQSIADVQMAHLEERMDNGISLLFYMQNRDSDCLKMLRQQDDSYEYESAKLKTYYGLKQMSSMINGGEGYFLYMQNKDDFLIYNSASGEKEYEAGLENYIQRNIPYLEGNGGWKIFHYDGSSYLVLIIKYPQYAYGTWISLENVMAQIRQDISYDGCKVAFRMEEPEQKKNVLSAIACQSGVYLDITLPEGIVTRNLTGYERSLVILCWIYLLCMPILFLVLRKLLIVPFLHAKDELYEKEIARQSMELQSLQFQIRPHFLLNTFNLVFSLAQRGENGMIQDTIIYLSDYFRHIFKSSGLEVFSKELHLLEGYRNLVDISHDGKIEITLDFEPEISLMRFPPLLLFSFLENAVSHAFDPEKMLHITVGGDYADQQVIFWVVDDGSGMSEETLARLQEMFKGKWKSENPRQHVGLYNSLQRLRYYYGQEAKIEVDRTEDGYTTFRIQIPYSLEVYDEMIDGDGRTMEEK